MINGAVESEIALSVRRKDETPSVSIAELRIDLLRLPSKTLLRRKSPSGNDRG
jgi:hypothetical protein